MDENILKSVRDALNNLYDSEHLRANPLAKIFGEAGRSDTAHSVKKSLESLIDGLKPKTGETNRSQKKRIYDLLYSRYVDQFSQKEVADQLGVSLSTYQREQRTALEYLTAILVEKYPAVLEFAKKQVQSGSHAKSHAVNESGTREVSSDEFLWMFAPSATKISDLDVVVKNACQLVQALAERYAVDLSCEVQENLPRAAIHSEALLLLLINLLSVAIRQSPTGKVNFQVHQEGWQAVIHLETLPGSFSPGVYSNADREGIDVVQKLVALSNGSIKISSAAHPFHAVIQLPTLESIPVLVIDDNLDNIQLLQRYLMNSRYRLISLSQPERAFEVIKMNSPSMIILDLMMPGIDGLEILTRLHSNADTYQIPIIVSTILPQEELVLSLGASDFLQKPVIQEYLLASLDRLVSDLEINSGSPAG